MRQSTQTEAYFGVIRQRIADGGYIWCKQFGRLLAQDSQSSFPRSLLDVGCQAAQLYQIIKTLPDICYHGIDIEPLYLDVAKQLFPELSDTVWEASILDWPEIAPYDYVTASAVLEHIEDSDTAFDNILSNTRRFALVRTFFRKRLRPTISKLKAPRMPIS